MKSFFQFIENGCITYVALYLLINFIMGILGIIDIYVCIYIYIYIYNPVFRHILRSIFSELNVQQVCIKFNIENEILLKTNFGLVL